MESGIAHCQHPLDYLHDQLNLRYRVSPLNRRLQPSGLLRVRRPERTHR